MLDLALRILIWAFVLGTSVAVVVRMLRGGRIEGGHNQLSVLPPSVRRWMLGESKGK